MPTTEITGDSVTTQVITAEEIVLISTPPTTPTSVGTRGQIAADSEYFYVCVATNTWARTSVSTQW